MKRMKAFPVIVLMAFAAALCVILSLRYAAENKEIAQVKQAKEGFTVVCPRLSRCGDAFLLYNDREAVMIDTGEAKDANVLKDLLREREIDAIDALILTHFDKDHIGGSPAILKAVPVKKCYMTCGSEDSDEFRDLMTALKESGTKQVVVTEPETFELLEAEFTIYPPLSALFEKDQDNNLSLITSVKAPEEKLLFTGDAQKERIQQFMESQYDGTKYTWLKVPHHGRDKGTTKTLLKKFVPDNAVITSSKKEPEDKKVVKLLKEEGVKVWLTREKTAEFSVSTGEDADSETKSDSGTKASKKTAASGTTKASEGTEESGIMEASDKDEDSEEAEISDGDEDFEGAETSGKDGDFEGASKVEAPSFSKEAGFYDKPFSLKLKAKKGLKIYYTLDCSVPTEESEEYTSAIQVEDPTDNPNLYSSRLDMQPYRHQTTSRYYAEVVPGWFSGNIPCGNVDKCQVVRAVAVDEDGNRSDVVTATYWVGYQNRKGYDDIPVLSLVSDPENLFSDETGIMVNGSAYKEKWLSGELDNITDTHTLRKYCNTFGKGREWEREVHMDFFNDKDQPLTFSQEAGIRLHGNQSRVTQSQKSFNLYAREEYDGNDTFLIPFYEDGILQDKVTLMRGDDLRNYFLSDKLNHRTMDTQNYRLVQVFLEGEYWGVYAIQEKYNSKEYLKVHYNLDKGEYILAKGTPTGYDIKKGDPEAAKTSFREVRDFAAEYDLSKDENYQMICNMMDMQSFIDGYAARLYLGDQDWSWFKNQYLIFYDQKWHWLIFDVDYGASMYNNTQPDSNTFLLPRLVKRFSLANDPLFPYLLKNKKFRRQFLNTFLDFGNETFQADRIRKEIDDFDETYRDVTNLEALRHITVGYVDEHENPDYISGIHQMCEKMKQFFNDRLKYASVYAADYCGFNGDQATVTLINKTPKGGTVKLGSITPTLDKKGQWSGLYYTDCPVILTAEPEEGWVFADWKTDRKGTLSQKKERKTRLSFTGDVTVKAVFRRK